MLRVNIENKERIFDNLAEGTTTKADIEPLYSSFTKDGVFIPPPSSKDALQRQRQGDKVNEYESIRNSLSKGSKKFSLKANSITMIRGK